MTNNKKLTLILSVLGVIVLVITIVGVSFALFSFTGTGVTENKITTGSVAINYADSYDTLNNPLGKGVIAISNAFPVSDQRALEEQSNVLDFTVSATINGKMNVNYDIGITDLVEGDTLTADYIKIALLNDDGYVLGTTTAGEILSSRKNKLGLNELIDNYYLASGSFSETGVHHYKLVVWVSDNYELPTSTTDEGTSHTTSSISEEFSFKVKVVAAQA